MEIFRLFGSMGLQGAENVEGHMSKINNTLDVISGSMMRFGGALTAGVTIPLMGLAVQGVRYNSTIQDIQTSFKVLLGSEENAIKLTKELKKVGAETPFELTGLAQASKTLLAFGIEQNKLIPTMTRIGDVSLGNNEAFQSMVRVMGQINALGKLQGGDLNQLINWGWNPLNEITKKTGETIEEVRKRMSKGKVTYKEVEDALIAATSAGGRFFGGMKEGSQTLSGRLSTLSDAFNEVLGETTKPLFDYISEKAVPFLTNLIDKISDLDPKIRNGVTGFALLLAAIGPLTLVAAGATAAISWLISILMSISAPVLIIVAGIGTLIGIFTSLTAATVMVMEKTGALQFVFNTIKDTITAIALLIKGDYSQAFVILNENLGLSYEDTVSFTTSIIHARDAIKKVIEVVKNVTELLGAIFTGNSQKQIDILIEKFGLSWDEAIDFAKAVFDLRNKVEEFGIKAREIALKFIAIFADKIKDTAKELYDNRKEIIDTIKKMVDFGFKAADTALKVWDAMMKIKNGVKEAIKAISQLNLPGTDLLKNIAIPKNAEGTLNFGGGLSIVGEKGPELVRLPRGSQIFSNDDTKRMLNSSSVSYNTVNKNSQTIIEKVIINAKDIKELNDLIKMFSKENLQLEYNAS